MSPYIVVVVFILTVVFALISTIHLLLGKSDPESAGLPEQTKTA